MGGMDVLFFSLSFYLYGTLGHVSPPVLVCVTLVFICKDFWGEIKLPM